MHSLVGLWPFATSGARQTGEELEGRVLRRRTALPPLPATIAVDSSDVADDGSSVWIDFSTKFFTMIGFAVGNKSAYSWPLSEWLNSALWLDSIENTGEQIPKVGRSEIEGFDISIIHRFSWSVIPKSSRFG